MGYKISNSPICYSCQAPIESPIRVCKDCHQFFHQMLHCQEIHSRLCLYHRRIRRFDSQRDFLMMK